MKRLFLSALLLAALIPYCSGANLAYSTYLRYGLTPQAMTSDAQGNLYLAGSAVIDPLSGTTSALVAKLDPTASKYLYVEYLDSAASDTVGGIALDAAGNLYVSCYASDNIYRISLDRTVTLLAYDRDGTTLARPTNIAFGGPGREYLYVANLGRWHINRVKLGIEVQALVNQKI